MPKGPQGQKRPADAVANAVMVARIATGEIEEVGCMHPPKDVVKGRAGGIARAAKLTAHRREQIASGAATERWR